MQDAGVERIGSATGREEQEKQLMREGVDGGLRSRMQEIWIEDSCQRTQCGAYLETGWYGSAMWYGCVRVSVGCGSMMLIQRL